MQLMICNHHYAISATTKEIHVFNPTNIEAGFFQTFLRNMAYDVGDYEKQADKIRREVRRNGRNRKG